MKFITKQGSKIVLRFDPGEDVMAGLAAFLTTEDIGASSVSGVGSAGEIEISWYNLQTKEYEKRTVREELEVLSLLGTTARLGDDPAIHIHGTFGRRDLTVLGGHVHRIAVLATVEIVLDLIPGATLRRAKDEATGLNLLQEGPIA